MSMKQFEFVVKLSEWYTVKARFMATDAEAEKIAKMMNSAYWPSGTGGSINCLADEPLPKCPDCGHAPGERGTYIDEYMQGRVSRGQIGPVVEGYFEEWARMNEAVRVSEQTMGPVEIYALPPADQVYVHKTEWTKQPPEPLAEKPPEDRPINFTEFLGS